MPCQLIGAMLFVCMIFAAQNGNLFAIQEKTDSFLSNGVTAHRGDSGAHPENTMPAFVSGIEIGSDWIELDIFKTKDGKLVVAHDKTTGRVGDQDLVVADSTFEQLQSVDIATDYRKRTGKSRDECPVQHIPLLEDVLKLVKKQDKTRVSIQPKMDCVPEAVALVTKMNAERWVGFNDGNLQYMAQVKQLAPEIHVFWDRGADTNIEEDIRIAKKYGFESLVINYHGLTVQKVEMVIAAGLEIGAWTVNDHETMQKLLNMGVQRIYTDYPGALLKLKFATKFRNVACEGTYQHHLQGICVDARSIYWSFTTTLVKTDLDGKLLKKISVANHHGDLCHHDGKIYVAVNLGEFNNPQGKADSWVYVYDATTLKEMSRHQVQEVFYGAGGMGYRDGKFFVVGGLPDDVEENYVYEYDPRFKFLKKHTIKSGHTHLGIQTATFAHDQWWFGCYGSPKVLLVTDSDFKLVGRFKYDCSLGIEELPNGRLLSASGKCEQGKGCGGKAQIVVPNETSGLGLLKSELNKY